MKYYIKILIIYLILFTFFSNSFSLSAHSKSRMISFTEEERNYIKKRSVIKVATMKDYNPFSYVRNNIPQGLSIDILNLISTKIGLKIKFIPDEWHHNINKLRKGEVDLITDISYNKKRLDCTLYTAPYYQIPIVVFGRDNFGNYRDCDDLKGKEIGILQDVFYKSKLKKLEDVSIIEFGNIDKLVKALAYSKIDGMITSFNQANVYIKKNGFTNIKILDEFKMEGVSKEDLRIGVTKNNPILHSIINKAFNSISAEEMRILQNRWIALKLPEKIENVILTESEKKFIRDNPEVSVATIKDYRPFAYAENGIPYGFSIDLIRLISQKTGLKIKFVPNEWYHNISNFKNKKIDLIDCISYKKDRTEFTLFTDPYYEIPIVIFGRNDFNWYLDLSSLSGKKVGIIKESFFKEELEKIDDIVIVEFNSDEELIKALAYGKLEVAINDMTQGVFYAQKNGITNIKILDELKLPSISKEDLRIGVDKDRPVLYSIINKGFKAVSKEEIVVLKDKWLGVEISNKISNKTPKILLTASEQKFITDHPVLRVGNEMDWSPFDFNENNTPKGLSIDYIKLLAEKIGFKLEFIYNLSWNELEEMFKNREIDILPAMYKNEAREKYTNYTKLYQKGNLALFINFRNDSIQNISDLDNHTVALVRGYGVNKEILKVFSEIKPIYYDYVTEAMRSVSIGKTDVTINYPLLVDYYAKTRQITNLKIVDYLDKYKSLMRASNLHIGVRKDMVILRGILEKAMSSVSHFEWQKIEDKWKRGVVITGSIKERNVIQLSKEEQKYLDNRGSIKMCVDPDWMPYEKINSKGKHEGMVADYISLFEKRIGKTIELVPTKSWAESIEFAKRRKCDILSAAAITPSRKKYMNFTDEYLLSPNVIVTRNSVSFIDDISNISDKEFAAVEGYAVIEKIRALYPKIKIVEVENVKSGLEAVSRGKVFGFIGTIPVVSYQIGKNSMIDLKIAGKIDVSSNSAIAVRDDDFVLFEIFQKAIASITKEEHQKIYNKWISVKYDRGFDYSLFWKIVAGIALLLLSSLFWNRKLSREIIQRMDAEKSLQESNRKLELRAEELKISNAKSEVAMKAKGEFLANVSHELRTPLNAVIGFSDLLFPMIHDPKQKDYIKSIKTASNILLKLINDILDLTKIEAGKFELKLRPVNIEVIVDEMRQIFKSYLEQKGIEFITKIEKDVPDGLLLDEVRLRQVLLNLIGNAGKFTEKGFVKVTIKKTFRTQEKDKITLNIIVEDSGIGIPQSSLGQIFETFKQANNQNIKNYGGTGLGLSICEKLIAAMDGNITVKSTLGRGSVFEIILNNIEISSYEADNLTSNNILNSENITTGESSIMELDDIDFVDIINGTKLVSLLDDEIMTSINSLKNVMVISDINRFGKRLKDISEEYKFTKLFKIGTNLLLFADVFDTVKIEKELDNLIKIIEELNISWQNDKKY